MPYANPESDLRWRQNRYQQRRKALIAKLGGCCVDCGKDYGPMEFDHLVERQWSNRQVGGLQRIRLYEREAARGEIALRCPECHDTRHGIIRRPQTRELALASGDDDDNRPF